MPTTLRWMYVVASVAAIFQFSEAPAANIVAQADALLVEFATTTPAVAVGVIRDGEVVYARAMGLADLDKNVAATTSTNFRLASVSKQFTAMAILKLIEQKKLTLSSTLCEIFPAFPAYGNEIVIRHLLNHTSGLPAYERLMLTTTTMPLLDRDVLWLLAQEDKTTSPPGTAFHYSNSGYAMLAMIVEQVSGQTFAAYMKDQVFSKIGMASTVVNERSITAIPDRALGYTSIPNGFRDSDQSLTSYVCGDGGIYSSVSDLVQWDRALYSSELVSTAMVQLAFTPETTAIDEKGKSYGFGWYVDQYHGKRRVYHTGSTCGFSNRIDRFLDDRFTVIVLTNCAGVNLSISQKLVDLFLFGETLTN